jgi:hypothetical protein
VTNCLLDRVGYWLASGNTNYAVFNAFRNCTMRGGSFSIGRQSANIGRVQMAILDCSFDGTTVSTSDAWSSTPSLTTYNYNAFLTNSSRTTPQGGSDTIVTNFSWQIGPLGRFYLPSDSVLIDVGSTTAHLAKLYHFTTQTNESSKEYTSTVDIGYHYVGTDALGVPSDYDSDGTPDYVEDSNGNGALDSGETDWLSGSDLGLRVFITKPKRSSSLP